jgi:hypothetical protein
MARRSGLSSPPSFETPGLCEAGLLQDKDLSLLTNCDYPAFVMIELS